MRMRGWATVGLVVLTACAPEPSGPPIPSPDQIAAKYRAQLAEIIRATDRQVVWPTCDDPRAPGGIPCGLVADHMMKPENLARFIRDSCKEDPAEQSATLHCRELFEDAFMEALRTRYPRQVASDVESHCAAPAGACRTKGLYELEVLISHNRAVYAQGERRVDEIVAEHAAAQDRASRQRQDAAQDEADRRRAAAAIAGALRGFAAGASAASSGEPAQDVYARPRASAAAPSGCHNDYQCGYGSVCVKPQFSIEGTCARAVNAYGTPTFQPPRADSVMPGSHGDCSFDTQCPVGFKCIKGSSLTGHCMK
jgi:hypothetical protein